MGPPLSRALGRGQSWALDPTSSAGTQGRSVPFREDIVKSVIRSTVLVANGHPSVPPPLEMVNGDGSQPSSPETLPRIRFHRKWYGVCGSQQEVPSLFWQEPLH